MLLAEFIPMKKIKIFATDIDKMVLKQAKKGIYDYKSLLNVPSEMLGRYFKRIDSKHYKISDEIKKCVHFRRLNLLEETVPPEVPPSYASITSAETITEVDASSVLGSTDAAACWLDADNGILYILDLRTAWSSGAKTLLAFDIEAGTYTTSNVTNNTGVQLGVAPNTFYVGMIAVVDGFLYLPRYNSKEIYFVNLSDNTDCGKVKFNDDTDLLLSDNFSIGKTVFLKTGSMLLMSSQLWRSEDTYTACAKLIDARKAYHINLVAPSTQSNDISNTCGAIGARNILYARGNDVIVTQPLFCLATKNNLESAVTKTADMTMRVTYTVTDSTP